MSTEKYIVFRLNEQEYGASIQQVMSIEKLLDMTKLPQVSDFIEGITKLRSEVIPVIDLKRRMDMDKTDKTDHSRMLIALVDDVSVGFIVDEASDVLDIDEEIIEIGTVIFVIIGILKYTKAISNFTFLVLVTIFIFSELFKKII